MTLNSFDGDVVNSVVKVYTGICGIESYYDAFIFVEVKIPVEAPF